MMLLDTHALLWLRTGNPRLGMRMRHAIDLEWRDGGVAVSALSFWEIAMLKRKGRIDFPEDVMLWRREQLERGLIEIPVDGHIAVKAAFLEDLHGDPADRIIVATALEGHRLVTADSRILNWPGPLDRLNAEE